jgi:para-nitrobenzyl esterase
MKSRHFFLLTLVFANTVLLSQSTGQPSVSTRGQNDPVVQTGFGKISGYSSNGISTFKGIPFASPPIGTLRWKAPQSPTPWNGVRPCKTFGPSPMQNAPAPFSMWSEEFLIPKEPISKDCLYLNVWSGAKSLGEKRPVLVWIYGGGFNSGGSAVPIYDGEALARKGIVFVSINYRVGIFGFFAHPELSSETGTGTSGNYGLLDQIAALQWVKNNIINFGGDPSNVTIAGQSAGSMSVNCLVASPLAKGLFRKAIAESGASVVGGRNASLKLAEEDGLKVQQKLGAASVSDMRNLPAESLQKTAQGVRGVIIDGYVLPDTIAKIVAWEKQNRVALLTGWNQDEGIQFGPPKNAVDFRKQIAQQYGGDTSIFFTHYPAATDAEAAASQVRLSNDAVFGVQNYTWANIESSQGKNVYVYRFTRKVPATGDYVKYGAFHTGEVPYAYDNLKFVNRPWEPVDRELAKVMSGYWVNFIKTGNPNGKGLPTWPLYTTKDKMIMELGAKQQARKLPDAAALQFLFEKLSKR